MDITLQPSTVGGSVRVPSSKSQTIRALLIALFASQQSTISHPLYSSDTRSALSACETLGAAIDATEERISPHSSLHLS